MHKKALILAVIAFLLLVSCEDRNADFGKFAAIDFPSYDILRAILGDGEDVEMILPPGGEIHSFEPSPKDMVLISNAHLVLYIGGESETWVDELVESVHSSSYLRLSDGIALLDEEVLDNMEGHIDQGDKDEHIWTSIPNYIKMIEMTLSAVINLDPENESLYSSNTRSYIERLSQLDQEFRKAVDESRLKTLIFSTRFPFRYFAEEYGLSYYAPFPGCSHDNEMSVKSAIGLIDTIVESDAKYVLKTEMSASEVESIIEEETGAKVLEFHSAHTVSPADFKNGRTYLDIMAENLKALRRALS